MPMSVRVVSMARLRRTASTVLIAMLPGLALAADGEPSWAGAAYDGTVSLHIALPDGKVHAQRGAASAEWVRESDNRVSLALHAKRSDAGSMTAMIIPGNYEHAGWRSTPGMIRLSVTPDGRIEGGGEDAGEQRRFTFQGQVTPTLFKLEHRMTVGRAEGGLPAGAVVTYDYDLHRDDRPQAGSFR